ncbi:hypothetical protein [Thiothrix subterranea]|uniref:Uncharacterized protein n=1 Tax=Thiothrix subterranea TaxID=2735563 RepID=A0AA51MR93_9GAMM|nr:hypothetical protein [Thiothrix subterranea]MDQ5770943.1 hypothetical protein [Thiothrix subterranea]WML86821.1 hypothetical protein RCG00_21380 [Thiothrix subterranea]
MKAIKASALLLMALTFSGLFSTAAANACPQPSASNNASSFERNSNDSSAWFDVLSDQG